MIDGLAQFGIHADPLEIWPVLAVLAVVAAVSLHRALRAFRQLRIIADTPTARLRSAPQGYVEVAGLARAHPSAVAAALTGKACVWYRFLVEEERGSGKDRSWVTMDRGSAPPAFLLDDGTGRCLVEPDGAEISCRARDVWYGGSRHPTGPPRRTLALFSRRYRYTEERIREQEPVYVLGNLETPRRGPGDRERLARELLRGWKRDPARMASFDSDGNGTIDAQEWDAARAKADRVAARSERRVQAEPPLPRVGPTGDARHPFVVSTHGEGDLIGRLRLAALGGTALFTAVAVGLGAMLFGRFG